MSRFVVCAHNKVLLGRDNVSNIFGQIWKTSVRCLPMAAISSRIGVRAEPLLVWCSSSGSDKASMEGKARGSLLFVGSCNGGSILAIERD